MKNKYKKENYLNVQKKLGNKIFEQSIQKIILDEYQKYIFGNVADFGCHTGSQVFYMSKMPNVKKVYGFDINKQAIKIALKDKKTFKDKTNVEFVHCDLTQFNWENEYFDFAFSSHTFEHFYPEDFETSLERMLKSLKIHGHFLVNMPDKHSYLWEKTHVLHINLEELSDFFKKFNCSLIEGYIDERSKQIGKSKNITALFKKDKK